MNLRNELPIAVHVASGGDARVRTGGQVISLGGISSGSFQVSGATGYRGVFSSRGTSGLMLLLGYTSPVTIANASHMAIDFGGFSDDVPDGTTVHFAIVKLEDFTSTQGAASDQVHVSFYG